MMLRRLVLLWGLLVGSISAMAQAGGSIEGVVQDENGKALKGATVDAIQGGITKLTTATDNFGKYTLKPLDPGTYTVQIRFKGRRTEELNDIVVSQGSATGAPKVKLVLSSTQITDINIKGAKTKVKPLDVVKIGQTPAVTAQTIEKLAGTDPIRAATLKAGVYNSKGNNFSLSGGRTGNTLFMVDGMLVRDANRAGAIYGTTDQVQVTLGGMPANLGDATGGVIQLTTKGPSARPTGSLNIQRSVDGYNNNQANFTLRGPLLKKAIANTTSKRTVLGYSLGLNGTFNADDDPNYNRNYRVNDSTLAYLRLNPLVAVERGGLVTFVNAGDFITADQLTSSRARVNAGNQSYSVQAKLDYAPIQGINIILGTQGTYGRRANYSFANSMFAYDANSLGDAYTGRAFLRLKQVLNTGAKTAVAEGEAPKANIIDKAYYTVQFSYEKNKNITQHMRHRTNFFNYGYVGKFRQYERPRYQLTTVKGGYTGIVNTGTTPDSLIFTPFDYNPNFTAYTNYVYNNVSEKPRNIADLQQLNGLMNGDAPDPIHGGMFTAVGAGIGNFSKSELDQSSVSFDASFDINTGIKRTEKLLEAGVNKDVRSTHAIEFGLYYDQRVSRSYSLGARGLWTLARQVVNSHITQLDTDNPIWTVNGQTYTLQDVKNGLYTPTQFDTIKFGRLNNGQESNLSQNLRKKLGIAADQFIYIDELDPTQLSLDMFSADDLYNSGSQYVSYWGYDHLGKRTRGRSSFEDFWKAKNEAGIYSRPVAPFNPIYVAGYIQDNFKFRDIRFRLGLRVDRYDANQKVMRDPYSLFPTLKVSDLTGKQYSLATDVSAGNITAPDPVNNSEFFNKFKDATVYVDNNSNSKPTIVGYRIGDTWFDPFGKEIANPDILNVKYTGGNTLQPYLQNKDDAKPTRIQSPDFDVNGSFKDYVPRINLSPRISFSFPVDGEKSLFYAHYDVVTQRPSNVFVSPDVYYFINQSSGETMNNANLSPERRIDYEIGFQQLLSKTSALKLSAFYIERKDQIQLQQFTAAYPQSYTTFGNRDFSTTKGMTSELNFYPTRELPMNLTVAYTLQFADGTGSNNQSQRTLLQSGQPNLRTVLPLDFDSRHNFTINTNYDLGTANDGNGILSFGKLHPFKNSSVNLTISARSGEPYTRLARAVSIFDGGFGNDIVGTVNGSRRPWTFNTDLRFDRDFTLFKYGKENAKGERQKVGLNVFAFANNLLNTRNILSVYSFTGLPDDDGYLESNFGQQFLNTITTSRTSYEDLYRLRLLNPDRFVNPRRIFVGATFNF